MAKSISVSAVILLCAALIQSAILSNITALPALPDLTLICVLYISLHNGRTCGLSTGFISGLLMDFLSACPFGLNCLYRTIIGYVGGLFNKTINTEGFLIPALLGFIATITKAVLLWIISLLYPSSVLAYNPISWLFLFELVMNTVLSPFIFKFLNLFKKVLLLKPETVV